MDKPDQNIPDKILSFLKALGLTDEESMVYLTLVKLGPSTVLQLSRNTGINRTRIYRLLDTLKKKSAAEELIGENRTMARAVNVESLNFLVKDQEAKTRMLSDNLPLISSYLNHFKASQQPGTKVLFYRGREGIRQQVWNTLKTKGELVGYSFRPLTELIGKYYEKWRREWIGRNFSMRDIYSDTYLEGKNSVKLKEDSLDSKSKYIVSRYISSKILNITHQMDIYNNVVSVYHWHEGEIFGVEIHNKEIAYSQKQIFEIVWKIAEGKMILL